MSNSLLLFQCITVRAAKNKPVGGKSVEIENGHDTCRCMILLTSKRALCWLESLQLVLLVMLWTIHTAEQAYLLLLPPLYSCVQYLYNSPWVFKKRKKKSSGSGWLFLSGITTLPEDQRERSAPCPLMGRSPPTGSSTMCIHCLLPFKSSLLGFSSFLLLLSSSTSLKPSLTSGPPLYQPAHPSTSSSNFCPLPLMCLFWTHHQNQDMGLWGFQGFLHNIIKNSHVSEYREQMKGKVRKREGLAANVN